jgi:hypothetical protein
MKNSISTVLTAALFAVIFTQSAKAQSPSIASNKSTFHSTHYIDSSVNTAEAINATSPTSGVHPRALNDFAKHYKNATNVYWLKCKDGGAVAGFTLADIKNWAAYNKKGWWLYNVKRYDESKLPKDIKRNVRYTYPDYKIVGIEEVEIPLKTIYLVHINKGSELITVRIADNEMEEIETFEGYQESTDK